MAHGAYYLRGAKWAWNNELLSGAFRNYDGDATLDEANGAADTFYHLPVFIGQENMVLATQLAKYVYRKGGSRYTTSVSRTGYIMPDLTFSGPVVDHSWGHQVSGAVETADNTPGAGFNTHQFDFAHTPNVTEPSIQLLCKIPNAGDGADLILLFVGSICPSYEESMVIGPDFTPMQGSYVFKVARVVTGTDLNTWPSYPDKDFFDQSHLGTAGFVLNDGGVALNVALKSYKYMFNTDRRFGHGGSYYPTRIYSPNNVDAVLELVLEDFDNHFANYTQDPDDANNLDSSLTFTRTASEDTWKIDFIDAIYELVGVTFGEQMETTIHVQYNPKEAAGNHQSTEVNDLDDDRYET